MRIVLLIPIVLALLTACASVPMAPAERDAGLKQFADPPEGRAGLYVYRDSIIGQSLKKTVTLDGVAIGETANRVYLYRDIEPGQHVLGTESEFGDSELTFVAERGRHYFFKQYIRFGAFVGGAGLMPVSEPEGRAGVMRCQLASGQ